MGLKRYKNDEPDFLIESFLEELVDVKIMVEQIKVYYKHMNETLKEFKKYKLYRLKKRLSDDF